MLIAGVSPFIGASIIIRGGTASERAAAPVSATAGPSQSRDQLLLLRDRIGVIRDSLRLLDNPLRGGTAVGRTYAPVTVSAGVALETGPARTASLQAVEEVNTSPTSYSPFGPQWQWSTAEATIDGVYDGAAGSGTMRIEVTRGGELGKSRVSLRIYNPDGSELRSFNINPYIPAGTPIALGNGLTITLDAGTLVKGDVLEVDLFHDVGASVDPEAAFDGVRNDRPNFDPGLAVGAGSFTVNGVTIDVAAGDSLLQVLDRITASAAGVTAAFDPGSETVRLEQKTAGAAYGIELGPDSSGFLAAVKLAGAVYEAGVGDEISAPLADVERFAAVAAGSLTINGVDIAFDPTVDSLLDVLDAINSAAAGAQASLDRATGVVVIEAPGGNRPLVLADGGSGLLTALGIESGEHGTVAAEASGGMAQIVTLRTAGLVEDLAAALNDIFDDAQTGAPGDFLTGLREGLRRAVDRSFGAGRDRYRTDFGLNFDFRRDADAVMRFNSRDRSSLLAALRRDTAPVRNLFAGRGGSGGLSGRMDAALRRAESELGRMLAEAGSLLDVTA